MLQKLNICIFAFTLIIASLAGPAETSGLYPCLSVLSASQHPQSDRSLKIDVWYGPNQKVGYCGIAQRDFNLLGNIQNSSALISLTYSLNGSEPRWLSVGDRPDGFGDALRLAKTGDFNADIPISELQEGKNSITLRATDNRGRMITKLVTVDYQHRPASLPISINWSDVNDPQNVGQYVDGKWKLTEDGLRTVETGYDRIFLIGEKDFRDFQVLTDVTIHSLDEKFGPRGGDRHGIGVIMRFRGHTIGGYKNWPYAQPKWGYMPLGLIGWITSRFEDNQKNNSITFDSTILSGDPKKKIHTPKDYQPGQTIMMKLKCVTLSGSDSDFAVTEYSFKTWIKGTPEPDDWDYQFKQKSRFSLRRGSVGLLAHYADVTFGDVTVTPVKN